MIESKILNLGQLDNLPEEHIYQVMNRQDAGLNLEHGEVLSISRWQMTAQNNSIRNG